LYVLVTNKHVIEDSESLRFSVRARDTDGGPNHGDQIHFAYNVAERNWIAHPDANVDLAVLPIAQFLNESREQDRHPCFVALDPTLIPNEEDLREYGAVENVVMVGYPIGLWDSVNNLPLARKGITATHPSIDYKGLVSACSR